MRYRSIGRRLGLLACVAAATAMTTAMTRVVDAKVQAGPEIYLLAGQSNMSGRGLLADLTPEERTADPAIRLYGNDEQWRVALDPLDDATGQVDPVSADPKAAVGPGLFFARALRRMHGGAVLLVPCAKGGSSMEEWTPSDRRDTLYGACLARARAVGGHVAGILWYQGETDAGRPEAAGAWQSDFEALVARFRLDLDDDRLPVVMVQLADPPSPEVSAPKTYPAWSAIQAAQAEPPPSCVDMVSAKGLPRKEDELHLTTEAHRQLGGRLAVAMEGLRGRGCR